MSFSSLLYKELTHNDKDNDNDKSITCLILGTSITENDAIRLYCGHTFSYDALLQEVKYQKRYVKQYSAERIKNNEIKCPYCRKKQKGILPYRDGYMKIQFVNVPEHLTMMTNKCNYILKNGKECNKLTRNEKCKCCLRKLEKQKVNSNIMKHENTTIQYCSAIRKNGNKCTYKCKGELNVCGIHSRYIGIKKS